jgi:hypothetical protein
MIHEADILWEIPLVVHVEMPAGSSVEQRDKEIGHGNVEEEQIETVVH